MTAKLARFVITLVLASVLLQACSPADLLSSARTGTPTCNICDGKQNPNALFNFLSQFVGK